jgi:hypothetical protein
VTHLATSRPWCNLSPRTKDWHARVRDRDAKLVELVRSGMSVRAAAAKLELGKSRACEIVRLYGIEHRVGRSRGT